MKKKIVLAAGGTGGHLFPALKLGEELKNMAEVLFMAHGLSKNVHFKRDLYQWCDVPSGTIAIKKPFYTLRSLKNLMVGFLKSRKILSKFRPDLVVGFGSYHSLPPLLAAKSLKIPFLVHEGNAHPGIVNRLMAPFATIVGSHFLEAKAKIGGDLISLPLRWDAESVKESKLEALRYFGLRDSDKTVLIFGGSQGSDAINQHLLGALRVLKEWDVQLIHLVGTKEEEYREIYQSLGMVAQVKDFEERMDLAYRASDLILSRAGAMTLSEIKEFKVPSILIPYPGAYNHQEINADAYIKETLGAVKLRERELTSHTLAQVFNDLFKDEGRKLKELQTNLENLKKVEPSRKLSEVVHSFLNKGEV